jgi:hypothetical protein
MDDRFPATLLDFRPKECHDHIIEYSEMQRLPAMGPMNLKHGICHDN